jgi:L-lactate dehydrogenase complex protein LldF
MSFVLDARARRTLPDAESLARHDAAVWRLRVERDAALSSLPDLEALRDHAAAIKAHTLDHLDRHLEEFEEQARARGAHVHWAGDAAAHNRIVAGILEARGARRVVKSKSMLTEECGLNPALEARGVEVVDSDLGERIVQLGGEPPSHIVIPAIHRRRDEVGALFHRHLGTPAGESDPERLMASARADLRARFLAADATITGVNFAVAATGTLVVVTNEGNADLGMSLAPLHVASLGIEKVIPALDDLAVFLRLLARSATGQALSVYTSLVTGPRPGGELHVVIVDAGRTRLLASPTHRNALRCIRCGACLNTCPVYRRAGGHAYGRSVAGPIGAVLAPALSPSPESRALPFASSLCGSCTAVCPVRIDLHGQLLAWRREAPAHGPGMRLTARIAGMVLTRPRVYRAAGRVLRRLWPLLERRWPGNPARAWLESRALPAHPGRSFAELWAERGSAGSPPAREASEP